MLNPRTEMIQVSPNTCQSIEDFEANQAYDDMCDNELQDKLIEDLKTPDSNIVY